MDIESRLASMTLEQKIGQMIIAGFETGSSDDPHFQTMVHRYHVGNVILFTRNLGEREETMHLTDGIRRTIEEDCGIAPFVVIDQEGGMVTRIFRAGNIVPGPMAVGATYDEKNAYRIGSIIGEEMRALGMNMDFAPSVEEALFRTPSNISVRTYSDNPYMVAAFCRQFVRGLQEHGVIATIKHFPGYTGVLEDAHLAVPTVFRTCNELEKVELQAFQKVIDDGADAVLAGHMLCPALEPERRLTSASRRVITELLKEKMGFKGLITSDCMDMHSLLDFYGAGRGAVEIVKAGVHLLDISHRLETQAEVCEALRQAVLDGEIPMEQIDDNVRHILKYKEKYGLMAAAEPAEKRAVSVDWAKNRRICEEISAKSVTIVRGDENLPLKKGNGLFISTKPITLVIVDEKIDAGNTFAVAAAQRMGGTAREISLNPTEDEIEVLAREAADKDYVVIGTYNAYCNEGQRKLLEAIRQNNKNLIAIALRASYDYDCYADIPTCLLAYEYTELSVHSVLDVLEGCKKAVGLAPLALGDSYIRKL